MLCRYDTPRLSSDAENYLSGILGKNGRKATTSSYHGDNDDDMMMMIWIIMMVMRDMVKKITAVLLKQPQSE